MADDDKLLADAWREAERIAEQRLGPRKADPASAGGVGAFSVAVIIGMFGAFSGTDTTGFALVICAAIGFAGPYFYFNSLRKERDKMIEQEFQWMKARIDAEKASKS